MGIHEGGIQPANIDGNLLRTRVSGVVGACGSSTWAMGALGIVLGTRELLYPDADR